MSLFNFDFKQYPLLIVDDERENLRVFELTFRRDFNVRTAMSGEEGLEILNTEPIAVIISDHKMPGMTGTEFLARAREMAPDTVRILLTAYGDAETLGQAINDGSIYRFVSKPWSPDELQVTLRRAVEHFAAERERDALLRELGTVNELARTVNQELAPDRVSEQVLSALNGDLGFDGASLLLYSEANQTLKMERSVPLGDAVDAATAGLEIAASGAPAFIGAMLRGESQILEMGNLLEFEKPVREWVTEVAADSVLVTPIPGKDTLLGALAVDNRSGSAPVGASQRVLLEGIAAQVGVAIQNARRMEDLRQSRLQVERADRLGTLGTLAAGLAHEINNPLVSIHTFLSLAGEKRSEDDEEFWGSYYDVARQEVDRIRELVSTMGRLANGSEQDALAAPASLLEIANCVVTLVEREAQAASVEVVVDPASEGFKTLCVREQIHQVALNLTLNAIHACSAGGTVTLGAFLQDPEGQARAIVEVRDTGEGIEEEDIERIFDPFFTTKDPDQGTGLGLMICHRIVTDHAGTIEVASRPGEGTTFRVCLPHREA